MPATPDDDTVDGAGRVPDDPPIEPDINRNPTACNPRTCKSATDNVAACTTDDVAGRNPRDTGRGFHDNLTGTTADKATALIATTVNRFDTTGKGPRGLGATHPPGGDDTTNGAGGIGGGTGIGSPNVRTPIPPDTTPSTRLAADAPSTPRSVGTPVPTKPTTNPTATHRRPRRPNETPIPAPPLARAPGSTPLDHDSGSYVNGLEMVSVVGR